MVQVYGAGQIAEGRYQQEAHQSVVQSESERRAELSESGLVILTGIFERLKSTMVQNLSEGQLRESNPVHELPRGYGITGKLVEA